MPLQGCFLMLRAPLDHGVGSLDVMSFAFGQKSEVEAFGEGGRSKHLSN